MKITAEITPPAQATHQGGQPGPWWCVLTIRLGETVLHSGTVTAKAPSDLHQFARLAAYKQLDLLWTELERAQRDVWRLT